jgi:hypothetical protein
MQVENTKLWKKIPTDIFINHIAPYSYRLNDNNLLTDIRNFAFDYNMIINYYYFDLNEYCLMIDLMWFCNKKLLFTAESTCFMDILNRNTVFNALSLGEKYQYMQHHFYYNTRIHAVKKNRFILALLTPSERAQFINEYIIEYYE